MMEPPYSASIEIDLNAAIVALRQEEPVILTVDPSQSSQSPALPFGPFDPATHRTLEIGLRTWVEEQTQLNLGYVEQLYTFGDRGRLVQENEAGAHVVSVSYLALTRILDDPDYHRVGYQSRSDRNWSRWYTHLPWEDWRNGRPAILDALLITELDRWVETNSKFGQGPGITDRRTRFDLAFGIDPFPWDEERVLERYELLYEAGLVEEAAKDGQQTISQPKRFAGEPMNSDHRRILATAIARLRGKLKYRPVVFELMSEAFTLTRLQRAVEAILGHHLHKQNFRRLVETAELVEPTGVKSVDTGGRPAALFRFRKDILRERPSPGLRI